jgi:protein-L-isoaspartate O-methyltransferase
MNGPSMDMLLSLSMGYKAAGEAVASQRQLVESLCANGLLQKESPLAKVMSAVDRASFGKGYDAVYEDKPLKMNGTVMTAPHMHALAVDALLKHVQNVEEIQTVADLGCGSGYVAALLEELFPSATVLAVDFEDVLERHTKDALADRSRVSVMTPEEFESLDQTVQVCHVGFAMKRSTAEQFAHTKLANGGVVVIPVGRQGSEQELMLIKKTADGSLQFEKIMQCLFSESRHREAQAPAEVAMVTPQEIQSKMDAVAEELKTWKADFESQNGRKPSVHEMPHELLEAYAQLKIVLRKAQAGTLKAPTMAL